MSDLISREAVLELTKIISEDYSRERDSFRCFIEKLPPVEPQGFEDYLKQYLGENDLKIIGNDVWEETKAKAEQTEWISVKDRLPTKSGLYLISTGDLVTTLSFDGHVFRTPFGDEYSVVAWMPLPSPYKGE